MEYADRISICHLCKQRERPCEGPCACLGDDARVDIEEHARQAACPKGYYDNPPAQAKGDSVAPRKPEIPLAGDVLENIIRRIGADRLARWWEKTTGGTCGCQERKEKLNCATQRLLNWFGR